MMTEATARAGLGVEVYRDVDVRPEALAKQRRFAARAASIFALRVDPLVVAEGPGLEAGDSLLRSPFARSCFNWSGVRTPSA